MTHPYSHCQSCCKYHLSKRCVCADASVGWLAACKVALFEQFATRSHINAIKSLNYCQYYKALFITQNYMNIHVLTCGNNKCKSNYTYTCVLICVNRWEQKKWGSLSSLWNKFHTPHQELKAQILESKWFKYTLAVWYCARYFYLSFFVSKWSKWQLLQKIF